MSSYMAPTDDFDSFIDFDGGFDANYGPEESTAFSGPSHDYSSNRQQTGFPMTNVVTYNDVAMNDNEFLSAPDFNSSSYMGAVDGNFPDVKFDMDFERPSRNNSAAAFFPSSGNMDDFVDPSAVYETQAAPVRMWPGMHSQQAEQAKMAALSRQQQQQQQTNSDQQMMPSQQQYLQQPSHTVINKGKQRAGSHQMADAAAADRKITDILDSMRHKSSIAAIEEDDDDSQSARARREEEELDEDERLLASEEGKKLSSKERRQLRNKVSARAFRSRRKEYISQLEGDLANKASEANDLRLINRKLLEENNQLKNLTRTVLSHPAFHNFLEDMSRNPTFVPPPPEMIAAQPNQMDTASSISSSTTEVKDESESQHGSFRAQEELQMNSIQIPEDSINLSTLKLGNAHWNQQSPAFAFQQPQVF